MEKELARKNGISDFPETWFSVIDYDVERKIFLPKLWDGTHLATNMRVLVCSKGTSSLRKEAWHAVANCGRTKLKPALAIDLCDKQNIGFALTTFSCEVEQEMRRLNFDEEANFCALVRNWYRAEDDPGISARQRYDWRNQLRRYMLSGFDFSKFPRYTSNVKGNQLYLSQFRERDRL